MKTISNKQFTAKIGIQGDSQALVNAVAKYRALSAEGSKGMDWDEYHKRKNEKVFISTWEDKLSNLSIVFNRVKNSPNCPNILAVEIEGAGRKGRRDVYILTDNNIAFRDHFYNTLEILQDEYKAKAL